MIKLQFSLVKSHNCMQTFAAVQHFYKPILIKVKKLIRQETNLGERDICLFILNWLGRKADACMLLPKITPSNSIQNGRWSYLLLGRNMDSLMKTEPDNRMYQQLPMSSGLKDRKRYISSECVNGDILTRSSQKYNEGWWTKWEFL